MQRGVGDELSAARLAVLVARVGLDRDGTTDTLLAKALADVERLVEVLGETAKRETIAEPLARRVLDWRDRMSSYLVAAHALEEISVDRGVAVNLLARGLLVIDAELSAGDATVGAAFT
jgi:hypothetical protein